MVCDQGLVTEWSRRENALPILRMRERSNFWRFIRPPSELIDVLAAQIDRPKRRSLGFVNLGASTSGQDSNDVDAMLADGFGRK